MNHRKILKHSLDGNLICLSLDMRTISCDNRWHCYIGKFEIKSEIMKCSPIFPCRVYVCFEI